MDVTAAVVAHEQSFELVEPGEGSLDDPAMAAKPGAVLCLAAGDLRLNAALPELAPANVIVVAAIGAEAIGPSPWTPDLAPDRRDAIDEADQLGAVMAVPAGERPGERDPGGIDEEMVLGAVSGSINRARARLGAPFFACT